jgi:hypothetical protein
MAKNRVRKDGWLLSVAASHPASPTSGAPVRYGTKTGVALTNKGAGGNASTNTSVDFGPSQWLLTVDDDLGTGIAVGDPIYYHDSGTGTGSVNLNNNASGANAYFGTADGVVTANATTAINVTHETIGALFTAAVGSGALQVAHATYNPSSDTAMRTIAAHTLGVTIPNKAVVCGGFIDVVTTFTSATDAATIALSIQSANDIRSAVAISTGTSWDAGAQPIIPKANTPESTSIKATADRLVTATVAVEALTAGKAEIYLYYLMSS